MAIDSGRVMLGAKAAGKVKAGVMVTPVGGQSATSECDFWSKC